MTVSGRVVEGHPPSVDIVPTYSSASCVSTHMTASMRAAGVDNGVLSFAFNQDSSRLALGTRKGTLTYTSNPFELLSEKPDEDASIIAMHYNTDLVAHVGAGEAAASSQRCLRLINSRKNKEITRRNYQSAILSVLLNRDRVVVVLETTIYIYELKSMDHLHTIEEIPSNSMGISALPTLANVDSKDSSRVFNFLAYPNNSSARGCVHVYDVLNLRAGPVIDAHNTRIACLSFNNDGTMLATASTKGTVFRIFSMPKGERLYEFRRSATTNALIYSMSFDMTSKLFCVSSDKPTIHIFKLDASEAPEQDGSWSSYLTKSMNSAATYLPTPVSDLWAQNRSFAQINLKHNRNGNPNLCAVCGVWPDNIYILVATSEGILYKYSVDTQKGGECTYDVAYPLCDTAEQPPAPVVFPESPVNTNGGSGKNVVDGGENAVGEDPSSITSIANGASTATASAGTSTHPTTTTAATDEEGVSGGEGKRNEDTANNRQSSAESTPSDVDTSLPGSDL